MSTMLRRQVLRASRALTVSSRPQIQAAPARLSTAIRSFGTSSPSSLASVASGTADAPLKSNVSTSSSALVSSTKSLIIDGHRIVAGAVVSRQPIILRDLSPFEEEYFLYQKNLERDQAAPFGADFYFKKGSLAERRWKQQEAERLAGAGSSSSKASKAPSSTSESTASSSESSSSSSASSSSTAGSANTSGEDAMAALEARVDYNPRITEADQTNDVKSLERALQRTLYLIVKKPRDQHAWQFPQGGVHVVENLQEAASRELQEECGGNMDLWFVGRVPIGHYTYSLPKGSKSESSIALKGTKVFFMKAHIFAGQVQVDNKEIDDFAWVTKQEMKDYVSPEYYEAVKDMLSDF